MTQPLLLILCSLAVIAATLVSGIFLAFSDFVMTSFASVSTSGAIESMQVINRRIYDSLFIKLLVGVAPFAILLTVFAYLRSTPITTAWLALGALTYLVGVIYITMKFNVPMNQQLDILEPATVEAASYWALYLKDWTNWNHIRTAASSASAICFLAACIQVSRGL